MALKNDLKEERPDQPEDVRAEKNRKQTCKSPRNSGSDWKLNGIRADLYRKPPDNPINGSQNANCQCQI